MRGVISARKYPLSTETSANTASQPLNKQKIATTNLPNMAFHLPLGGAVEHAGSGQCFFLGLCFFINSRITDSARKKTDATY